MAKLEIMTLENLTQYDGLIKNHVAEAVKEVDDKVGSLADLGTTNKTDLVVAINEVRNSVSAGGTQAAIAITTEGTTDGMLKSYTIKQGTNVVGVIDIPKDIFPVSGSVVVDPDGQDSGTYIELVIENQETPIYINVASLIDNYTAQASATQIQLTVDNSTREISATIVDGSVDADALAENAVTTAKIADANVTLAKLGSDVTPTLTQVATNKTNIEALQTLVGDGVKSIEASAIAALFSN